MPLTEAEAAEIDDAVFDDQMEQLCELVRLLKLGGLTLPGLTLPELVEFITKTYLAGA